MVSHHHHVQWSSQVVSHGTIRFLWSIRCVYYKTILNNFYNNLISSIHPTCEVKFPLGLTNLTRSHGDVWGSGGISPLFLTSALDGAEWSASRACNRTLGRNPPPPPPPPQCPMYRRLIVPQRWSWRYGEEKNLLPLPGIEPWLHCPKLSPPYISIVWSSNL
jgi:hypothetical protein